MLSNCHSARPVRHISAKLAVKRRLGIPSLESEKGVPERPLCTSKNRRFLIRKWLAKGPPPSGVQTVDRESVASGGLRCQSGTGYAALVTSRTHNGAQRSGVSAQRCTASRREQPWFWEWAPYGLKCSPAMPKTTYFYHPGFRPTSPRIRPTQPGNKSKFGPPMGPLLYKFGPGRNHQCWAEFGYFPACRATCGAMGGVASHGPILRHIRPDGPKWPHVAPCVTI